MPRHLLFALAAAGVVLAGGVAHADPYFPILGSSVAFSATDATNATTPPFPLADLTPVSGTANSSGLISNAPVNFVGGTIVFSPDNSVPQAGVYKARTNNSAARDPYLGTSLPDNNFIVAEAHDPVDFYFNSLQSRFGLLWGSVDSYNSLQVGFYFAGALLGTGTITGADVATAAGIPGNGSRDAFVSIFDSNAPVPFIGADVHGFDEIQIVSTSPAFEFAPSVQVPEPASIALFGVGLLGLGMMVTRRRRQNGIAA